MDNELIIDGQAVPLSENQEAAEIPEPQAENEMPEQENLIPPENAPTTDTTPDDYVLHIGDEEIPLAEEDEAIDGKAAPQWVKEIRKGFKDTQKENRELRRQLEELQSKPTTEQSPSSDAPPPKPTLEGCDYDEARFEQALTDWHEKKSHAEQMKQQQQRQQQDYQQHFQQRLQQHKARAAQLPVNDYEEMEDIVRAEIPDLQKEILIHAADEGSELIAYALGKNQKLRQRVAAETDPLRAAFLLGQISQQARLAPKPRQAPKPEPEVRGGGADAKYDEFSKLCPGATIE